jgi:4-hydroxy-2-oxoheptanedioate aldolase
MFRENRLKRRIKAGKPSLGVWLQIADPSAAEIASLSGYDFLILDNEHGYASLDTLVHMMRAAQSTDATVMVRCSGSDGDYIKRVLDAGAEALMIPMVDDAEEARAIVRASLYPPAGRRGYSSPTVRASGYGAAADHAERANEELLITVQIESTEAVGRAAEIAAVDGVDCVFIGAADLAGSLNHMGDLAHPEVEARIKDCVDAVRSTGKPLGTIPRPGTSVLDLAGQGYLMLAGVADAAALRQAFTADVAAFRKQTGEG